MPEQKIFCRRILLDGDWAENQVLEVDGAGRIGSIHEQAGGNTDLELPGPVIPGMTNLHSHAFQWLMTGLTGSQSHVEDNFWTWRESMYRFAERIGPEELRHCAAWLYARMMCAGYTACAEFHYLHHRPDGRAYEDPAEMSHSLFSAAEQSGMRLSLLPVLYQRAGFKDPSIGARQRRFHHELDEYLALLNRVEALSARVEGTRIGVAPHSLRAVPRASLTRLVEAIPADMPVHIHIAEQAAEVRDCMDVHGARPVAWLLDSQAVDHRWCLVHATHVDASERRTAAARGVVAGLCPSTEADLGDGFFDTRAWLDDGGRFGIGSDSNLRISPAEELRLLEFSERLRSGRRNVLRGAQQQAGAFLWQHAARHGAAAIGQDCGVIEVGRYADLVELDPQHPFVANCDPAALLDTLVFGDHGDMIRSVLVGGRLRVKQGRHVEAAQLERSFATVCAVLRS